MIYKILIFHKNVHILEYGTYSNKFLPLFFIMPKNAPHKININCQDITPTCFSENTSSSVSPKTHCSNSFYFFTNLIHLVFFTILGYLFLHVSDQLVHHQEDQMLNYTRQSNTNTNTNTNGHPRQINDRGNDARSCLCN